MLILVHSAPTSLLRDHGHHPNLGVLSSPRRFYPEAHEKGYRWAADNDAYLAWDEDRYLTMLEAIRHLDGCLFVTAPDVVGDAESTLELFWKYYGQLRITSQPVALVAQDGIERTRVPWRAIGAVFIGGTTEFKLGPVAAGIVREAKQRGKWVHMGRVNTRKRIRYARSLGCDSIDGTNFSMYRRTSLPWALTWASSPQLWEDA